MVIIILLILYTFLIFQDLIPKFRNKTKKEAFITLIIYIVTLVVLILESLDINVPGPTNVIKNIINTFK